MSSAVQAVADLYGPHDFARIDGFLKGQGCAASQINHNTAQGFESLYLGAALPQVPAKVKQANPITYLDAKDPPFLIENGGQDCNVGTAQGAWLADALRKVGVPYQKVLFPNAGHGGADFKTASNAQRIVAFLKRYVKEANTNGDPARPATAHASKRLARPSRPLVNGFGPISSDCRDEVIRMPAIHFEFEVFNPSGRGWESRRTEGRWHTIGDSARSYGIRRNLYKQYRVTSGLHSATWPYLDRFRA